jgi:hypothetical protein
MISTQIDHTSNLEIQYKAWDAYLNTYVSTMEGKISRYQSTGSKDKLGLLDWNFNTNGKVIDRIEFQDSSSVVSLYTAQDRTDPSYQLDLRPSMPVFQLPEPVYDKWLVGTIPITASGSRMTALVDYPTQFNQLSQSFDTDYIAGYQYRINQGPWNDAIEPISSTIEDGLLEVVASTSAIHGGINRNTPSYDRIFSHAAVTGQISSRAQTHFKDLNGNPLNFSIVTDPERYKEEFDAFLDLQATHAPSANTSKLSSGTSGTGHLTSTTNEGVNYEGSINIAPSKEIIINGDVISGSNIDFSTVGHGHKLTIKGDLIAEGQLNFVNNISNLVIEGNIIASTDITFPQISQLTVGGNIVSVGEVIFANSVTNVQVGGSIYAEQVMFGTPEKPWTHLDQMKLNGSIFALEGQAYFGTINHLEVGGGIFARTDVVMTNHIHELIVAGFMGAKETLNFNPGTGNAILGGLTSGLDILHNSDLNYGVIQVGYNPPVLEESDHTVDLTYGHSNQTMISIDNQPPGIPQLSIVEYDEAANRYTIQVSNIVDQESGLRKVDGRNYQITCISCGEDTIVTYQPNQQFEMHEKDYLAGQFQVVVEDQVGNSNGLPMGITVNIQDNPTDDPWLRLEPTLASITNLSVRLNSSDSYVEITEGSTFRMSDIHSRYLTTNQRVGLQTLEILTQYELEDGRHLTYTHTVKYNVIPRWIEAVITENPTDNPTITLNKKAVTVKKIEVKMDDLGSFVEVDSGQAFELADIHHTFNDRAKRLGRHKLTAQITHTLRDGTDGISEEVIYFDVIPDIFSVSISEIPNDNPEIVVTQLASFVDTLKVRLDERNDFVNVTSGDSNYMADINSYFDRVERREGWHKLEVVAEYDLGSGVATQIEIIDFEVVPNLVDVVITPNPTDDPNLIFNALTTAVEAIHVQIDELGSYKLVSSGDAYDMQDIHSIFAERSLRVGWHKLDVQVTYLRSDLSRGEHTFTMYYKVNPGIDAQLRTSSATNPATKPVFIKLEYDRPVLDKWGRLGVKVKERYYAITSTSARPDDASYEWKILRSDSFSVTETEKKDVYVHLKIVDSDGIIKQDPPRPLYIQFNYKFNLY